MREAAARTALWTGPAIFGLWVYWAGLTCWFQADDFAWLGGRLEVHDWRSFLRLMFEPRAQGTIRPLSERGFFLLFERLFGLDALPFRVVAFATYVLNVYLISRLAERTTGSRMAAGVAAAAWAINPALGLPMAWTSSYNQLMCAAFLLAAMLNFVRWTETGSRGDRWRYWIFFLLGFGALELNVVFPALAGCWVLVRARHAWRALPAPAAVSLVYAVAHRMAAPKIDSGPYVMHWDAGMFNTLATYWRMALVPEAFERSAPSPWLLALGAWIPWILTGAIAVWLAVRLRARDWAAVMPLAWFVVVISPVLPLRDHVSHYYLTAPVIGVALALGWMTATAWMRRWWMGLVALALVVAYSATAIPTARSIVAYYHKRSHEVRNLLRGIQRARELNPDRIILLAGITHDLFWGGISDNPFRLMEIRDVYLAPETTAGIGSLPKESNAEEWTLGAPIARRLLKNGGAVVYKLEEGKLKKYTRHYYRAISQTGAPGWADRVDVGNPLYADHLGDGWGAVEGRQRWMKRKGEVRVAAPVRRDQRLRIQAYCVAEQTREGPLSVDVSVNGEPQARVLVRTCGKPVEAVYPLSPDWVGREQLNVVIEVDRPLRPEAGVELGLVFGSIEVR